MNLFDKIGLFAMLVAIYAQVIAVTLYWPAVAVLFAGLLLMYWSDKLDAAWWQWRQRRRYRQAQEAERAAEIERTGPDMFGGQWEDDPAVQERLDTSVGPKG